MDKMKITSSEPKYYVGISVKGLITSLDLKIIVSSKKEKKARYAITNESKKNKKVKYAITNVSMKDLTKIIKDFLKLP